MPVDPEAVHDRLASGDPGRLRGLALDVFTAAEGIDRAADRIAHGTDTPFWTGAAGWAYRTAGRQTYVAAAATSWHLCRAGDFVVAAADRYDLVLRDALRVIKFWRQRDTALTPDQVDRLRAQVLLNLGVVARGYSTWLRDAGAALHRDGGRVFEDWLVTGLEKEYALKARTGAVSGPRIPDSLLSGEDYVPQGLGYDPVTGWTFHSAYRLDPDGGPDDSRLTIIDHDTGREVTNVNLLGVGPTPAPTHSGGVAVIGDNVYVVGGGVLYTYSLAQIRSAGPGANVPPLAVDDDVPATSYVTEHRGKLYLGLWSDPGTDGDGYQGEDKGALFEYDPRAGRVTETYWSPEGVNGAVLQDGSVTYAVNSGRYEPSTLVTYEHADGAVGDKQNELSVGNLVEELALVDGRIVVTSEAGALPYSPFDDDGGTDTSWDRLDELWAQSRLTEIPEGVVTGAFDVEPPTLEEAARAFDVATDELDTAAGRVVSLTLPDWVLGDVADAAGFASKVDAYLDQAAQNIEAGKGTTGGMSGGLLSQARTYEDTDDAVAGGWSGRGLLGALEHGVSTPEAPPPA